MLPLKCLWIFFLGISLTKCEKSDQYLLIFEGDLTPEEMQAKRKIEEIQPSIEQNMKWEAELLYHDRDKISFVDEIGLEFELEEVMDFFRKITNELRQFDYKGFKNEKLKRLISLLLIDDYKILDEHERTEMEHLLAEAKNAVNDMKFCEFEKTECKMGFFEMLLYMVLSEEKDEIMWYWREWRDKAGKPRRQKFERYIELYQKAARLNGFAKPTSMMLKSYEDPEIVDKLTSAVDQLSPLYQQLHAFIRHKLNEDFGDEEVPLDEAIPEHIYARFSFAAELNERKLDYPYEGKLFSDASVKMRNQNYTYKKILHQSDEFFKSLGFDQVVSFDGMDYIKVNNEDGCEPKASHMLADKTLYFVLCKENDIGTFLKTHGEMLKVHHYKLTRPLPFFYRDFETRAYEKALREAVILSVASTSYLKNVGLIEPSEVDEESLMNRLYLVALRVLFPLHESFVEAKYMADVLDGRISLSDSNCAYWNLYEKYQGVQPPVKRSENDFDIIAGKLKGFTQDDFKNVFAKIVSFQLYETLCNATDWQKKTGHLHDCNFAGNHEAGDLLKDTLGAGGLQPWQKHLDQLKAVGDIDVAPILRYFEPLRVWLEDYNKKNNIHVGWKSVKPCSA